MTKSRVATPLALCAFTRFRPSELSFSTTYSSYGSLEAMEGTRTRVGRLMAKCSGTFFLTNPAFPIGLSSL